MEDVTERRRAEEEVAKTAADLKAIETFSQNIVDTVREPLLMLDTTLRVHSANRAFYQTFHVSRKKPSTTSFTSWATANGISPRYETLLEDIVPKNSVFSDFELEHTFPVIGRRVMLLNARKLKAGNHGELLVLAMEDVTERRRAEEELAKPRKPPKPPTAPRACSRQHEPRVAHAAQCHPGLLRDAAGGSHGPGGWRMSSPDLQKIHGAGRTCSRSSTISSTFPKSKPAKWSCFLKLSTCPI